MRVIVTRPKLEAKKWVDALGQAGLQAQALPLIAVSAAPDTVALRRAWDCLPSCDAVMFVSGNAVDYFFASNWAVGPVFTAQAAIKTRAIVTGPGSYAALMRAGCEAQWIDAPDLEAGQFDSEALWAVVGHRVGPGFRVLIVRGMGDASPESDVGHGRDWFARQVIEAGGQVEFVVSYRRHSPVMDAKDLELVAQAAEDGSVWLFSSSEAIANLAARVPGQSWAHARAVATHPRIAQAAREAGFAVVCESRPTLQALIASLESLQ
jgi:uroporphyrinogen-III synthase